MKLKLQNTYRHLLNFTADGKTRPILGTFHFDGLGNIEATNSHILLRLLNHVPTNGLEINLQPKELRHVVGNYPDTKRLFPGEYDVTLILSPEEASKIAKFLKTFEKNSHIEVSVLEKGIQITNTVISSTFDLVDYPTGDYKDLRIYVNSTYLGYIVNFIAECSLVPVQLSINKKMYRPIVFQVPGQFEGLIAQLKKPGVY
jgi:hypothetical protein